MNKRNVESILERLKKEGYCCFVSEAQLRDAFAIELGKKNHDLKIIPEYSPQNNPYGFVFGDKQIKFDLFCIDTTNNKKTAIEFKYKTKKMQTSLFNEEIVLKDQKDTTNGRYDVWEDIYRLEQFVKAEKFDNGLFIFITNHKTYINPPRKNSDSFPFSIEGRKVHKAGKKEWPANSKRIDINNFCLEIGHDYIFEYEKYNIIDGVSFYLLIVEINK